MSFDFSRTDLGMSSISGGIPYSSLLGGDSFGRSSSSRFDSREDPFSSDSSSLLGSGGSSSFFSNDSLSLSLSAAISSSTSDRSSASPPHGRNIIQKAESSKKKQIVKDDAYWLRRKKNNDAAKRSRDIRKNREDDMAQRASVLERENWRLKLEVDHLRAETDQLRDIFFNTSSSSRLDDSSIGLARLISHTSSSSSSSSSSSNPLSSSSNPLIPSSCDLSPSSTTSVSSSTSPSLPIRPVPIHPFSVISRTSVLVAPSF